MTKPGIRCWLAMGTIAALVTLGSAGSASAVQATGPRVFPNKFTAAGVTVQLPFQGKTYGQWAAAWWQWALSAPTPVNPLVDPVGADCAAGQSGSVWFLAGTFGGAVTRTCNVPVGRSLFFPVANNVFIATEPQ